MTAALPDDTAPRVTELDIRRFRAAAHKSDSAQYRWLAGALAAAGQASAAERALRWANQHERLALNLLRLRGRA